jgi:hypothetical protein
MVVEGDVGIVVFANDAAPVAAILRHRYADFKVNEISEDMKVAKYTDDALPEVKATPAATFGNEAAVLRLVTGFTQLAGEEKGNMLREFLKRLQQRVRF